MKMRQRLTLLPVGHFTPRTLCRGQLGRSHIINQSFFLSLPTSPLSVCGSSPLIWPDTIYSDLLPFMIGLTSEMKVAQVVCNNLLDGLLCAQFDSTWEKDVPFPSRRNCVAFMRYLYIRHTNDSWKHHRLLTVRQTQVAHRGTFQCCIWGATRKQHISAQLFDRSLGEQDAYKSTTTHTCPRVQKYDHKTEHNRAENTSPGYDPHVKSVTVFNSVDLEKDQEDTFSLSGHGTATWTTSYKFA